MAFPLSWNPHAPDVLGVEWAAFGPGRGNQEVQVAGSTLGLAQSFISSATETVDSVWLRVGSSSRINQMPVCLDIYTAAAAAAGPGVRTRTQVALSAVSNNVGFLDQVTGAPATAATLAALDNHMWGWGPASSIDLSFATSGFADGVRPVVVQLDMYTSVYGINPSPTEWRYTSFEASGAFLPLANSVSGSSLIVVPFGDIVPKTIGYVQWLPLTAAELRRFVSGAGRVVRITPPGSTGGMPGSFDMVLLDVTTVPETRSACGAGVPGPTTIVPDPWAEGWLRIPVTTPAGGAWTKTAGVTYTMVLRSAVLPPAAPPNPTLGWAGLFGAPDQPIPNPSLVFQTANLNANGEAATLNAVVDNSTRSFGMFSGTTERVDSEPYGMGAWEVYTGGTVSQVIMPTVSESYTGFLFYSTCISQDRASPSFGTGVIPNGPLTITLKNNATNAVLATATLAAPTVAETIFGTWTTYAPLFAGGSVALTAGTAVRVEFTTTATFARLWWIYALIGGPAVSAGMYNPANPSTLQPGFVGSTSVLLVAQAAAISGLTATGLSQATTNPVPTMPGYVPVSGIAYTHLAWTASALTTTFSHYDIARIDPWTGTTYVIASIYNKTWVTFDDYEARLGVRSFYMVRQVRVDGSWSAWSATVGSTIGAQGCELTFTSNEDPGANVAYPDTFDAGGGSGAVSGADRQWTFPEAGEVVYKAMYGRDYMVAFHPLERRGVAFQMTLLISALVAPALPGPDTFGPLRDLAWAPLSYVCVRDSTGGRWYTSLAVGSGEIAQPGDRYVVTVGAIEVTDQPSNPDPSAS